MCYKNILSNSIKISRNTTFLESQQQHTHRHTQTKQCKHAHITGMFHGPVHPMPWIVRHRLDAFKPALVLWHNAQRGLSAGRFSHNLHWDTCHTVPQICQSNRTTPVSSISSPLILKDEDKTV